MSARRAKVLLADGLSSELQVGKAAEHLVAADLFLNGIAVFPADAGMPYDLVVDHGGALIRVQVKGTMAPYERVRDGRTIGSYRFGMRKGRSYARMDAQRVDVIAFVALDLRAVAYLRIQDLIRPDGRVAGLTEFATVSDAKRWGSRLFSKCAAFPFSPVDRSTKACFHCDVVYPATDEYFVPNRRCRGGITGICRPCGRRANTQAARDRRGR